MTTSTAPTLHVAALPACRFCDSPRTTHARTFADVTHPLVHCLACDGVFALEDFDAAQLADAYRKLYEPGEQYDPHLGEFEDVKAGRVPRLGWNKRRFFRVAPRRLAGIKILEIGAGAGVFGLACITRGADYRGYDLSSTIVAAVRRDTKIPVSEGTWQTAVRDAVPGSYDFVVGWEVFEHLPDIRDAFEGLRTLLKPGGRLVFSVPNYLRYHYTSHNRLGQDPPPIHLSFWSPTAMTNFLRVCGFAVTSLEVKPYRSANLRAIREVALAKLGRFHGPTMVVVASRDDARERARGPAQLTPTDA